MDKKRIIWLSILTALCLILILLFILTVFGDRGKQGRPLDFQTDDQSVEPLERRTIALYFPSEEDDLLHPENREIPVYASVALQARRTMEELIAGPSAGLINPIPPETKLRELYLTSQGDAYVDFSREIRENHLFGSSADIATIYSIVHSLTENFEEIKRVYILIEGGEWDTLGGHIDLRRPFLPRPDLIASPR
jgi:spore germination protein GerM